MWSQGKWLCSSLKLRGALTEKRGWTFGDRELSSWVLGRCGRQLGIPSFQVYHLGLSALIPYPREMIILEGPEEFQALQLQHISCHFLSTQEMIMRPS
jgi:hypothetical protein